VARLQVAEDELAEAGSSRTRLRQRFTAGCRPSGRSSRDLPHSRTDRFLARALRMAGLAYALGHADLFGECVVRDLLACLRLALNPGDRTALVRLVDTP
jgi:hypothetical protein